VLASLWTFGCAAVASVGALSRLRAVARATAYDLPELTRALPRGGSSERLARLVQAQGTDDADGTWEGELLRAVSGAGSHEAARAAANEVLLDVEAKLAWGAHFPAAFARISLFGALLAGVLLVSREARLTPEVLDVIALGAAGAMVSIMAGVEATKMARSRRKSVDKFVDRLMVAGGWQRSEGEGAGRAAEKEPE
jgi:hypothetical protein